MKNKVIHGDCLEVLGTMPSDSIDSIVTDPPYGINFMGKKWDYDVPGVEVFRECLRVLKPGGYILCACGTRTQHRMACNIEDAGFEIRDVVTWLYGSGFPKSLDISKAIDKKLGAEREVIGYKNPHFDGGIRKHTSAPQFTELAGNKRKLNDTDNGMVSITAPATDEAKQWQGYGTALKPAQEFFTLARKPLGCKTIAENVLKHSTGGLNIDDCRVECDLEKEDLARGRRSNGNAIFGSTKKEVKIEANTQGRFPANVIHDGSDCIVEQFPDSKNSVSKNVNRNQKANNAMLWADKTRISDKEVYNDKGTAARFFYCAKASKAERCGSKHPTVKPIMLMEYLIKLITPKGGVVLDPFAGSGTTGVAAKKLGFGYILIEREAEYVADINNRLYNCKKIAI